MFQQLSSIRHCGKVHVTLNCSTLLLFAGMLWDVDAFSEPVVHTEHLKEFVGNSVRDPQSHRGKGGEV